MASAVRDSQNSDCVKSGSTGPDDAPDDADNVNAEPEEQEAAARQRITNVNAEPEEQEAAAAAANYQAEPAAAVKAKQREQEAAAVAAVVAAAAKAKTKEEHKMLFDETKQKSSALETIDNRQVEPMHGDELHQEKLKAKALEEENKALRGQVATTLCYLGQVMPITVAGQTTLPPAYVWDRKVRQMVPLDPAPTPTQSPSPLTQASSAETLTNDEEHSEVSDVNMRW